MGEKMADAEKQAQQHVKMSDGSSRVKCALLVMMSATLMTLCVCIVIIDHRIFSPGGIQNIIVVDYGDQHDEGEVVEEVFLQNPSNDAQVDKLDMSFLLPSLIFEIAERELEMSKVFAENGGIANDQELPTENVALFDGWKQEDAEIEAYSKAFEDSKTIVIDIVTEHYKNIEAFDETSTFQPEEIPTKPVKDSQRSSKKYHDDKKTPAPKSQKNASYETKSEVPASLGVELPESQLPVEQSPLQGANVGVNADLLPIFGGHSDVTFVLSKPASTFLEPSDELSDAMPMWDTIISLFLNGW